VSSRPRGGAKPRDYGTGVVCASLADEGRWLSLGTVHPRHGFIELSGAPPFDERRRGRPAYTREYRARLAHVETAFLHVEDAADLRVRSVVRAVRGKRSISQMLRLHAAHDQPPALVRLRFGGRLDRPPLAMITEVAPAPHRQPSRTTLRAEGRQLLVTAGRLAAEAQIKVSGDGVGAWAVDQRGASLTVAWPSDSRELVVRVECSLQVPSEIGARVARPRRLARRPLPTARSELSVPTHLRSDLRAIARRALSYVRDCTCLRVAPGRAVILTDHRLLPLSWTRDAYFQAMLLLRHGSESLVADHLRWLWLTCHRSAGSWARSHHADGRRKDDVYQADQQLYPLLELANYARAIGELPRLDRTSAGWPELAGEVVADLAARLAADDLLPTAENAADDPADLPYLLANQILAVHTLERLAELAAPLDLGRTPAALAGRIRRAIERHFTVEHHGRALWAYAVDGRGGRLLYHDANDVPTALAPLWGFCPADDPRWQATMDFAFSPANEAYAAGAFGGLGSHHTPGVWPLGLIQEWVVRSLSRQPTLADAALRRLVACALADGSLPEASDPATARAVARHWFAWPGALLGWLLPAQ
jgi:uncharacterized protein